MKHVVSGPRHLFTREPSSMVGVPPTNHRNSKACIGMRSHPFEIPPPLFAHLRHHPSHPATASTQTTLSPTRPHTFERTPRKMKRLSVGAHQPSSFKLTPSRDHRYIVHLPITFSWGRLPPIASTAFDHQHPAPSRLPHTRLPPSPNPSRPRTLARAVRTCIYSRGPPTASGHRQAQPAQ